MIVITASQELRFPRPSAPRFRSNISITFIECIKTDILEPLMLLHGLTCSRGHRVLLAGGRVSIYPRGGTTYRSCSKGISSSRWSHLLSNRFSQSISKSAVKTADFLSLSDWYCKRLSTRLHRMDHLGYFLQEGYNNTLLLICFLGDTPALSGASAATVPRQAPTNMAHSSSSA
jgi:hypothetical protein